VQDLVAGALERPVPDAILAVGHEAVMGLAAVGLDDQADVAPDEVGPVGAERDLRLRQRDAVAGAQLEEQRFELVLGEAGAGDVAVEDVAEGGGPWPQLGQIEVVQPLRLADGRL